MDDTTAEALERTIIPYYGIYRSLTKASEKTTDAADNADIQALELLERRQEIEMRMAVEVEIEEFYDAMGEGSLGLAMDEAAVTLGAKGKGQKVMRRVYRFTGVRPDALTGPGE